MEVMVTPSADYTGMAKAYRQHLIDEWNIEQKETTEGSEHSN